MSDDPFDLHIDPLTRMQADLLYKIFESGVPTPLKDLQPGMPVSIMMDHDRYSFGLPLAEDGALVVAELLQGRYLRTFEMLRATNSSSALTVYVIELRGNEVFASLYDDGTGELHAGGPTYDIKLGVQHKEYVVTFRP